MKLVSKSAAVLLALALLTPASMSGLWASPMQAGMHCSGCGPALALPPVIPQAGAVPGRCCEFSSKKQAPAPVSIPPQGSGTQMSPPAAVEAPSAPPAPAPTPDHAPPPSSACPQALHCSFLI